MTRRSTSVRERFLVRALIAWLFGWFVLARYLLPYFTGEIFEIAVRQPGFPVGFDNPVAAKFAYVLPITFFAVLVQPKIRLIRAAAVAATLVASMLLLHSDAYNDATFLTSAWLALWMVWVSRGDERRPEVWVPEAAALVLCIGAFFFLGGAVGKLHADWWSGETYYEVILNQRDVLYFPWLRENFDESQLRSIATALARTAVVAELVAVTTPLMPLRVGLTVMIAICAGVVLTTGWMLLSVLGALIAILTICHIEVGKLNRVRVKG